MDLVNEYLRAVAALLPRAQRDDIIAELRDTILTRIEAREGELGRPLIEDEVEAVLREVGHPVVIAARYREGPQHLVGATLYPYWLFAVKAAIALQVVVALVVVAVRTLAFDDFSRALGHAIGSGVTGVLVLIGAATCAAWFIERRGARIDYLDNWRVRDLRYLEIAAWDFDAWREWFARQTQYPHAHRRPEPRPDRGPAQGQAQSQGRKPASTYAEMTPMTPMPWHPTLRPMARGLGFIAIGTVLVLWWTGVTPLGLTLDAADWASLDLDPGAFAKVNWMAVRAVLFLPILAYATALILQGALMLAHPYAVRLQGLLEAGRGAALLGFCAWLWKGSLLGPAVGVTSSADFFLRMAMFRESPPVPLEPIATIVVLIAGLSACGLIGRGVWRLVAGAPPMYADLPPPGFPHSAM